MFTLGWVPAAGCLWLQVEWGLGKVILPFRAADGTYQALLAAWDQLVTQAYALPYVRLQTGAGATLTLRRLSDVSGVVVDVTVTMGSTPPVHVQSILGEAAWGPTLEKLAAALHGERMALGSGPCPWTLGATSEASATAPAGAEMPPTAGRC